MTNTLQIHLLGDFRINYGDTLVTTLAADRLQSLLVYLLLHQDAPQSRQLLAFSLWPDSTEAQARNNLRNLLHSLRRALPDAELFLNIEASTLRWNPQAPFVLDVAEYQTALKEARRAEQEGDAVRLREALERAIEIYRGDLWVSGYDEWVIPIREELRHSFFNALEQLVRLLEEMGDLRNAIRYGQRLVQLDPLHEASYAHLMRLYALKGDRAGVHQTYHSCIAILERELGIQPSRATQEAYESFLRLEPPQSTHPLALSPASLTSPAPPPTRENTWTLPSQPTPFLGREEELEEVAVLLSDPSCRLLTIIGPGGVGKSRLALRAAEVYREATGYPAAFVPLTPLGSPSLVVPAIAEALSFSFYGTDRSSDQLVDFLREKQMLLVLDNFEHLLESVDLVGNLLQQAPGVKVLVTSRERLNLLEEWVFGMGGLPVPNEGDLLSGTLEQNSAVALFLQSARRAHRAFVLTEAEQGAVAQICQMVDGMPLGIELAAAWVRMLSPTEIAQEIERSLDFLVGTQRNVPERHRSLRAVFDHSWAFLTPQEQTTLRRLSLFRGHFTREAAMQVAGASLSLLASLTDKSLLRRDDTGRYNLHEVVRQYAAAQLATEPDEERETRNRHIAYFSEWLAHSEIPLKNQQQRETIAAISARIDDVRAAWQWATEAHQLVNLNRMIPTLHWFYEVRNDFHEGVLLFEQTEQTLRRSGMLPTLVESDLTATWGFILCELGWFRFRLGQNAEATALLQEALQAVAPLGTVLPLYYINVDLSYVALVNGDWNEARRFAAEALANANALDSVWHRAVALSILGAVSHQQGDLNDSYHQLHASLTLARKVGDPRLLAFTLHYLGTVALALGNEVETIATLRESAETAASTGDRWAQATALNLLGHVLLTQGNLAEALSLFQQCLALYRDVGNRLGTASALANIGETNALLDNPNTARQHYAEALELASEAQGISTQADILWGVAKLEARASDEESALIKILTLLRQPAASIEVRRAAEQLRTEIESRLTPETVEAARVRAQAITFEEMVQQVRQMLVAVRFPLTG